MNKIVQNPAHPFDLSLNSLILIYKKFEQAKRVSNNPNQEILIDVLVQLVARLINQDPSPLQKSLSNALYKNTISWNEFLNFLDKESDARQNILNWIMYQMNVKQFKFNRTINLKFLNSFQQITYFESLTFQGKKYYALILDNIKLILLEKDTNSIINTFFIQRESNDYQKQFIKLQKQKRHSNVSIPTKRVISDGKLKRGLSSMYRIESKIDSNIKKKPSMISMRKFQRNKHSTIIQEYTTVGLLDDENYYKRERKKINSVFEIFKQLQVKPSINLAEYLSPRISSRKIQQINLNEIKQLYNDLLIVQKKQNQKFGCEKVDVKVNRIEEFMKQFEQDKKIFSYNPYQLNSELNRSITSRYTYQKKRINFEKKEKEKFYFIRSICYLQKYNLFALALFNFQIILLRIKRQYNKVIFHQQYRIKIQKEIDKKMDRKKNQIIQKICFHSHQIINRDQLLVLIRGQGVSFVKVFNLIVQQIGQKKISEISFALSEEIFSIKIDFQSTIISSESDFGFHVIGSYGTFSCYKDNWNDNCELYQLKFTQEFKSELIFSCFDVSVLKKKMIFGTVGGDILFVDSLTKKTLLTKKISNKSILNTIFNDITNQVIILSADQIVTIYDTNKLQQVQSLRVKNEDRLNEKINMSSIYSHNGQVILYCYGSELKQFIPFIDQQKYNKKRKIQITYKWRLQKMKDSKHTLNARHPSFITQKQINTQEIIGVVSTQKHFVIINKKNELKLISKKSYKIKYSLILDLDVTQNIITFKVSNDSKMLIFSLESQKIKAINVYTEQIYQVFEIKQKITHLEFLSDRNQYFIVTGSETGKVTFIPSNQLKLDPKIYQAHNKTITAFMIIQDNLITAAQDSKFIVWQLPFNTIKYEIFLNQIFLNQKRNKEYILEINQGKNLYKILCRGYSGLIYEIDAKNGHIKQSHDELSSINILNFFYNEENNELFIIDEDLNLTVYEYVQQKFKSMIVNSQKKLDKSTVRKIKRKDTSKSGRKFGSQTITSQTLSKWRFKLKTTLKEKDIQFAMILSNNILKNECFFLSKGGFYVYDELLERINGKHNYTTELQHTQSNKNTLHKRPVSSNK